MTLWVFGVWQHSQRVLPESLTILFQMRMIITNGAMMIRSYKLDGHTPVLCDDFLDSAKWMQEADRRVAQTLIGEIHISTVFLGFDHGFGEGPPVLFETMVFGGMLDQEMDRYCTWEEAEIGHDQMVQRVVESEKWHNRMKFILKLIFLNLRTKVTLVKRYIRNRLFSIRLR